MSDGPAYILYRFCPRVEEWEPLFVFRTQAEANAQVEKTNPDWRDSPEAGVVARQRRCLFDSTTNNTPFEQKAADMWAAAMGSGAPNVRSQEWTQPDE